MSETNQHSGTRTATDHPDREERCFTVCGSQTIALPESNAQSTTTNTCSFLNPNEMHGLFVLPTYGESTLKHCPPPYERNIQKVTDILHEGDSKQTTICLMSHTS